MTNEVSAKSAEMIIRELTEIPDVNEMEPDVIEMEREYWTPSAVGETRRLIFIKIEELMQPDYNDKDKLVLKDTVIFVSQSEDGTYKQIENSSALMVGTFEKYASQAPFPVVVQYEGKRKAKTTGNMCDAWAVKKLVAKKG